MGLWPLIDLSGPLGPQVIGLNKKAVVRDATSCNGWKIMTSRSRNPIISTIKNALPYWIDIIDCEVDDVYLWKLEHHPPTPLFSSTLTWLALHPSTCPVLWHKSIWFKDYIPNHAFINWVVAWNRASH